MLKPLALILTLLGILSLSLLFLFQKPIPVNSTEQLLNLTENQQVIASGQVEGESYLSTYKVLTLDNNLEILCDISCPYLINQHITVLGIYDNFQKPRIKALKIKVQNDN